MGVSIGFSKCSADGSLSKCRSVSKCVYVTVPTESAYGNPNPSRFRILRSMEFGNCAPKCYSVVEVQYPDSKNYEGRKVLLYRHPVATVVAQTKLDPHFCDDGSHISPFARFEPTEDGWIAAIATAEAMAR